MTSTGKAKDEQARPQAAAGEAEQQAAQPAGVEELESLRRDFERLREDVAGLTEALQAVLAARREGGEEAAGEEAQWEQVRERVEQTRRHGREALDDLEVEVARHPLASLALAFGVGYLYARLTHLFR